MDYDWDPYDAFKERDPGPDLAADQKARFLPYTLAALKSEWYGLDPKKGGDPRFFMPYWGPFDSKEDTLRPGIVDDTASVGALPYALLEKEPPKTISNSMSREQELEAKLLEQAGLPAPHGLTSDNFAWNLGKMLGQLPLPGGAIGKVGKMLPRGLRAATAPLRWAAEYFGPTVHPSIGNYVAPAAMGTGISTLLDPGEEPAEAPIDSSDPTLQFTPEEIDAILSRLSDRSGKIQGTDRGDDEMVRKAKGGPIKPTMMSLRDRLKSLISDASVEGTGKEMIPVDPMTPGSPKAESMPTLEQMAGKLAELQPDVLDKVMQTPVSRRSLLKGAAKTAMSMASPIDPLSLLKGSGDPPLHQELLGAVEPVATAAAIDPNWVANGLNKIFWKVVGPSDEGDFVEALNIAQEIPGSESLQKWLAKWQGLLETVKDPSDPRMHKWGQQFEDELTRVAEKHGAWVDQPEDLRSEPRFSGPDLDELENTSEDIFPYWNHPPTIDEMAQARPLLQRYREIASKYSYDVPQTEEDESDVERIGNLLEKMGFDTESWGSDVDSGHYDHILPHNPDGFTPAPRPRPLIPSDHSYERHGTRRAWELQDLLSGGDPILGRELPEPIRAEFLKLQHRMHEVGMDTDEGDELYQKLSQLIDSIED